MRSEQEIESIIVTLNDVMRFQCGRSLIDPSNREWRRYIGDPQFDYRLYAAAIRGHFDGGGSLNADAATVGIRRIYARLRKERSEAALPEPSGSACGCCRGVRNVWAATSLSTGRFIDFRHEEPPRDVCIGMVPCPGCRAGEYRRDGTRRRLLRMYMPPSVLPRDGSGAGSAPLAGDAAIRICFERAARRKAGKETAGAEDTGHPH
ncbi:MAG: hypothetical protein HPZ91_06860 [Lentisphaeria bacterium]|nr:hypothetical protein [Lentisphaeria bacterium]